MVSDRVRRFLLAGSAALLLAACGGGTVVSDFSPNRVVAFGDSVTFLGSGGTGRYTINDSSTNIWALRLASRYGLTVADVGGGGTGYAEAHARINSSTDATGGTGTRSVKQQIDRFLAAGSPTANDLVTVGAGTADLIAEGKKVIDGTQTQAAAITAVKQAAQDLATQVQRLIDAGARHVVVFGAYNMGRTPWATSASRTDFLEELTTQFNNELVVRLNGNATHVLFVDAQLAMNNLTGSGAYNATDLACTPTSAGNALGIGTGQVNSSLCTASTLAAGFDANKYLYADAVYPTPMAHRSLGDYAYDKVRERW